MNELKSYLFASIVLLNKATEEIRKLEGTALEDLKYDICYPLDAIQELYDKLNEVEIRR